MSLVGRIYSIAINNLNNYEMLKYFRKIRQKLMQENKFSKYLLYAVGEIVLVVIGILIALQINNWNNTKQNEKEFEKIVEAFESDLIRNIEESTIVIQRDYRRDSLVDLVLKKKATREMYRSELGLRRLITASYPFNVLDDNLILLLEKEEQFPKKYFPLLPLLKQYKSQIKDHTRNTERNDLQINENFYYFVENFPWFRKSDSLSKEMAIGYFLNDPIYWNKVYAIRAWQFNNGTFHVSGVRAYSLAILGQIRQIKNGYNLDWFKQFLIENGMTPFRYLDCSDHLQVEPKIKISLKFLIYNSRNEEVSIFMLNDHGERIIELKLKPREFLINWLGSPVNDNQIFEWGDSKNCFQKYVSTVDGYLVIE